MRRWSRLQQAEIARAKRVIEDPDATAEEKREAKILIGANSVDPVLMAASGGNLFHYGRLQTGNSTNRHEQAPRPPGRKSLVRRLFGL